MNKGTIYNVGIDLGTSRTSIATSTGVRETVITCVGYPKDMIAQKRLGNLPLLGQQAIDKRLSLTMVWPLRDGIIDIKNKRAMKSVKLIISHIIKETLPDITSDDKIFATIGVPARASVESKKVIVNLCKELFSKILIVSEPFMVAYSLDIFDEALIVDIGAGTVDLMRMKGTMPDTNDQITINTAGNWLDNKLTEGLIAKYPNIQLSSQIIRKIKEKYGYYCGDTSTKIIIPLTEKGIQKDYDITEPLKQVCLEFVSLICVKITELVGSFDPEFQERLRNNIVIAGGGSRLRDIDKAVEYSLIKYGGGSARCVQDAEFSGANGALKMALEMPDEYWEKV